MGERIALSGRIQSREYQKKLSETDIRVMTAYEVSINKLAACDSAEAFDLDEEFSFLAAEPNDTYQMLKNV